MSRSRLRGWRLPLALLGLGLVGQMGVSAYLLGEGAVPTVLAPPPPRTAVPALSLGDDEAWYRATALALQNAVDGAGVVTPVDELDYRVAVGWLDLFDQLRPQSALNYGAARQPANLRLIIGWLERHAAAAPAQRWRWLLHGVYLARHRLRDDGLALRLARTLAQAPDPALPGWIRRIALVIAASSGRVSDPEKFLAEILASDPSISPRELLVLRRRLAGQPSRALEKK